MRVRCMKPGPYLRGVYGFKPPKFWKHFLAYENLRSILSGKHIKYKVRA
jgi:hypothetical protein